MGIIYEQPLNELVRTTLRLEYLFQQLQDNLDDTSSWNNYLALSSILHIVTILDRPDLRSKLTKEFHRYISNFGRMKQAPNADIHKIDELVEQFQGIIEILHNKHGKFGQRLRENEFLSGIRQRLSNPGGTCCADSPAYHYWLNQPSNERQAQLQEWANLLANIKNTMELMLGIIRQSGTVSEEEAVQGFFQKALDPAQPYQLIRIEVDPQLKVYPEISAGKHRVTAYFYTPSLEERPEQTQESLKFKLMMCSL